MSLNPSSAHTDPLIVLLEVEPLLVFLEFLCHTVSLLLTLYPPFDLLLSLSRSQGSTNCIRFLASAILKESLHPCTDSAPSPEGMLLKQLIKVISRIHRYSKNLSVRLASASVSLLAIVTMSLGHFSGLGSYSDPDSHMSVNRSALQPLLPMSAGLWFCLLYTSPSPRDA